jgi:Family of unknown function (DUF6790)
MIALIVALMSVLLPLLHLVLSKTPRSGGRAVYLLLLYALVLDVGVIGLFLGFVPHVFFADEAAKLIGWPPGSPFQFEVGFHDLAARFGWQQGSAGRFSCLGPRMAISTTRSAKETMLLTTS